MQVIGQFEIVTVKNVPLKIYVISNDTDILLNRARACAMQINTAIFVRSTLP